MAPTSPWKLWKSPAAAPLSFVWPSASPGWRDGSPMGRKGGGARNKIGGTWQTQPLGEIPDRLPFRKPYMPESTHTKQTHREGLAL